MLIRILPFLAMKKRTMIRGLEKNKLRKFGLGIFFFSKAKNAGDAAHQRVFLTQQKMKRTSQMRRLFFSKAPIKNDAFLSATSFC